MLTVSCKHEDTRNRQNESFMLEVLRLIQTREFKSRSSASLAKPDQKSHLFSYFNIACNEYKKTTYIDGRNEAFQNSESVKPLHHKMIHAPIGSQII